MSESFSYSFNRFLQTADSFRKKVSAESLTYSIRSKKDIIFAIYTECNKIRNILVTIFGDQAQCFPSYFSFWHLVTFLLVRLEKFKNKYAGPKRELIEPCGSSTVYLGPTHITNGELCVFFTHRRTSMLTTCLHADVRVSVMSKWNGRSLIMRKIGLLIHNTIMVKSWKLLWKMYIF